MNISLEVARLWFEARHGYAVRAGSDHLVGVDPDLGFFELPGTGDQVGPTVYVVTSETKILGGLRASLGPGGQHYDVLLVDPTLALTAPPQFPLLVITLGRLVDDLQSWTLDDPGAEALLQQYSAGRIWHFLLATGHYRSHRIPVHRQTWHVVPAEGGWLLKEQKSDEPGTAFPRKEDAVHAGMEKGRSVELGQLIIHREDGTFEEVRAYGRSHC